MQIRKVLIDENSGYKGLDSYLISIYFCLLVLKSIGNQLHTFVSTNL